MSRLLRILCSIGLHPVLEQVQCDYGRHTEWRCGLCGYVHSSGPDGAPPPLPREPTQ